MRLIRSLACLLPLLSALPATAQDGPGEIADPHAGTNTQDTGGSHEAGGSDDATTEDISDIMNEIDLGPGDQSGGDESITYSGGISQTAPDYKPGTLVTVTHSGGTIAVYCQERDGIAARLSYNLAGTRKTALKAYGDGIGLAVWGNAGGGGVKTRMPSKPSSIQSADVALVVNLPTQARVKVVGGNGWVQVLGCEGSVAASNRSGDVQITGKLTNVWAQAPRGNVKVELDPDSRLVSTNKIYAGGGSAELSLPLAFSGRFYAKGASVMVEPLVQGTNSPTLVSGTIGDGGRASLSITAKTDVKVRSAN